MGGGGGGGDNDGEGKGGRMIEWVGTRGREKRRKGEGSTGKRKEDD